MDRSEQRGFDDVAAMPYPWESVIEFFDRLYGTDYAAQVE